MGPVGNGGLRLRHLGCADLPEPDGRIGRATAGRADAGIRSARTALRCRPAPPPVSGRRDGALRRLALRTDSASCGECRQRMALRMAAAARQRLGFAAARDDAGGRFGRFGQRHRFVRHLEHDLGLARHSAVRRTRRASAASPSTPDAMSSRPSCSQSFFKCCGTAGT